MRLRLLAILLVLGPSCNCAAPGYAQVPAPDAPPRVSRQDRRDLSRAERPPMDLLTTTMAGQRVLAAGYGRWDAEVPEKDLAQAERMIGRLQVVSEAASGREDGLIPFVVGKSWVLAPETREEVTTDAAGAALYEALPRRTLMEMAVTALTPAQVKRFGTERGLPLSDLPPEARSALLAALRPPMELRAWMTKEAPDGTSHSIPDTVRMIDEPLDFAHARIRAILRMNGIGFDAGKDRSGFVSTRHENADGALYLEEIGGSFTGENEQTFISSVPNRFKPADLDGRGFPQPVGIQGTFWLPDVLAQLQKVTGLRLRAASGYWRMPVFIGSGQVACGEVLDGLRLALTASWRKLGDTYVFAWDKRGLGALQQMALESQMALADRIGSVYRQVETAPRWLDIAYNLPFAPDDPLALDEKQRHLLFDPDWNLGDGPETQPRIMFPAMRPDQQDYLRSLIGTAKVDVLSRPPMERRTEAEMLAAKTPLTEDTVSRAYLRSTFDVEVRLEIPGIGWVAAPPGWLSGALHPHRLTGARDTANGQPVTTPFLKLLQDVKPCALPAETRALMVPVLTAERLVALAGEMKSHGFYTLLYPALYGGYATFPSQAFPLYPSLDGQDGLAAVAKTMAPDGIRIVPYVSTLAWRVAGDSTHWLDAYPDWVDRDVLGRTRRDVMRGYPRLKRRPALARHAPGDIVRPTEPAVLAKLQAFVAELSRRKEIDAMAFTDVYTDSQVLYDEQLHLPPLGYAVPDRLAAVKDGRDDPVDVALSGIPYRVPFTPKSPGANITVDRGEEAVASNGARATRPGDDLLAALLDRVRSTRKDMKTWLVDGSSPAWYGPKPAARPDRPKPDVFIPTSPNVPNGTRLVSVPPHDARWTEEAPNVERRFPAMVWSMLAFSRPDAFEGMKDARFQVMVLDFRTCPEDITDSLKWVLPPKQAPR